MDRRTGTGTRASRRPSPRIARMPLRLRSVPRSISPPTSVELTRRSATSSRSPATRRPIADADRGRAARAARISRSSATATPSSPAPSSGATGRVVIAGHIDTVPVNGNLPTRIDSSAASDVLWGRGTVDMKARRRGAAQARRRADRARRRHHLDLVRPRGGRREPERPRTRCARRVPICSRATSRSSASRPTPVIEGGCNGNLRVEIRAFGQARARGPRLGRATTPSTSSRRSSTARGLRAARGRGRRPRLPGGPQRGRHHRAESPATSSPTRPWCTSTTGSRPAAPPQRRSQHMRELFDGFDLRSSTSPSGARPGLDAPLAQEFVAAVGGSPAPEVRLDGCRPLRRARHPRGQLRSGRPAARARRRRARARRPDPRLRGGPAGVADAGLTTAPARPAGADGSSRGRCLRGSWSALPWWGRALAVFAASRLVTTLLYLWVAAQGTPASRAGVRPDLVDPLDRLGRPVVLVRRRARLPGGAAAHRLRRRRHEPVGVPAPVPVPGQGAVARRDRRVAAGRRARLARGRVRRGGAAVPAAATAHRRRTGGLRRRPVRLLAARVRAAGRVRGVARPRPAARRALPRRPASLRRRDPGRGARWRSPARMRCRSPSRSGCTCCSGSARHGRGGIRCPGASSSPAWC